MSKGSQERQSDCKEALLEDKQMRESAKTLERLTISQLPPIEKYINCHHKFKIQIYSDLEEFYEEDPIGGKDYLTNNMKVRRHLKCELCGLFKIDRKESNPFTGLKRR